MSVTSSMFIKKGVKLELLERLYDHALLVKSDIHYWTIGRISSEIVGSYATVDVFDTLTGDEKCSLVELLHNNFYRTNHPLLDCKYSEVVDIRANIYLFIDDDTDFIELINALKMYFDRIGKDPRTCSIWLDVLVNSQWTNDQSRPTLLAAFIDEVRQDGDVFTSLAELEPLLEPSFSALTTSSDPLYDRARAYFEKAKEIYIEASNTRNTKKMQQAVGLCNESLAALAAAPGDGNKSMKREIYNKMILAYTSLDSNDKVIELCGILLVIDPTDTKTLFKRALASEKLEDYERALKDIEDVMLVHKDPATKSYQQVLDVFNRIKNKSWRVKWVYSYDETVDLYQKFFSLKYANAAAVAHSMAKIREELQGFIAKEDYKSLNFFAQRTSATLRLNQVTLGKDINSMGLVELKYCVRRAKLNASAATTQSEYIALLSSFLERNPNPIVGVESTDDETNKKIIIEQVEKLVKENLKQAKELENNKNYVEANRLYENVLKSCLTVYGRCNENTDQARLGIARIFLKRGNLEDSQELFQVIIEQRMDALSPSHPTILECFEYLEQCQNAAVTAAPDDETTVDNLYDLGSRLFERGAYREAQAKFVEAAVIAERVYGENSEEVFALKDEIGAMIFYQGETERGLQARTINLSEMKRVLGVSNLKAQQISSLIGVSLFKKELYERAIPHFREQMDELVNAFGYMESNTIMTIQNLAANIGCLAEKRIAQLRADKAEYNEMLMEQIMGGLDEAIELCKTVIEYSYEAYSYQASVHLQTYSKLRDELRQRYAQHNIEMK